MSIETELSTLAANKAAIKAAIEAKNPATAPTDDMSQWPTSIASISGGGSVDCSLVEWIGFNSLGESIDTGLSYFPDFECDVEVPQDNKARALHMDVDHQLERYSSESPYWHVIAGGEVLSDVSVYGRNLIKLKNGVVSINGVQKGTIQSRTWGQSKTYVPIDPGGAQTFKYTFKLYSLKCWDESGNLVRSFLPFRIGTTAYLYDEVSRSIFSNLGAGVFTYGSDV